MNNNVNPYDVLELRRLKFCPPHFETINIPKRYNMEESICDWITTNLYGRFYFGINVFLNETNSLSQTYTVGFETHKELSYFMLACPFLKYNIN